MPAKSQAQHRYMERCAHEPQHAAGQCPAPSVVREYVGHGQAVKDLPERVTKKKGA